MTAGSNGMSTSGSAVSARTEIITTESAASVARHFATQMAEQGWTSDANWNGAATAGSSWSRRGQDGNLVQATLMVMAAGEGRIRATLRLGKL